MLRHIAARNVFFRWPRSMYVSSDKRKSWRFVTVSSCSAGLDFKPSRRVIVITLNLEDRVVPWLPSSVFSPRKTLSLFSFVVWEATKQRQVSIGSSFFNFRLSRRCAVGQEGWQERKTRWKVDGTEARVEGLEERKCG